MSADENLWLKRDNIVTSLPGYTPETAWAEAARCDQEYPHYAPYTIVALTPVPRPVPRRPTAIIAGEPCEFVNGRLRIVGTTNTRLINGVAEAILAAAKLIADTEAHEAKYGVQAKLSHVCGLQGYDPMRDKPCPACSAYANAAGAEGGEDLWIVLASDNKSAGPGAPVLSRKDAEAILARYEREGSYGPYRLARLMPEGE